MQLTDIGCRTPLYCAMHIDTYLLVDFFHNLQQTVCKPWIFILAMRGLGLQSIRALDPRSSILILRNVSPDPPHLSLVSRLLAVLVRQVGRASANVQRSNASLGLVYHSSFSPSSVEIQAADLLPTETPLLRRGMRLRRDEIGRAAAHRDMSVRHSISLWVSRLSWNATGGVEVCQSFSTETACVAAACPFVHKWNFFMTSRRMLPLSLTYQQ